MFLCNLLSKYSSHRLEKTGYLTLRKHRRNTCPRFYHYAVYKVIKLGFKCLQTVNFY